MHLAQMLLLYSKHIALVIAATCSSICCLERVHLQVRTIGGVPFGALVTCVIVGILVVYVTQQGSGSGSRRRKGRSTDRTD